MEKYEEYIGKLKIREIKITRVNRETQKDNKIDADGKNKSYWSKPS